MRGLEGIKVVELATFVAAPACPRILAEMGAEIIKIEPFEGDAMRTQGPGYGMERNDTEDPAFDMPSLGKNWLSVNLKNTDGIEFVYDLLKNADVMVTNFRDKALNKLGLDYKTISEKFPHLVYAHMRGYGERGPEKDTPGYDATAYSARGGILTAFPQSGESPVNVPAAFGDWNASGFLSAGILAALVRKAQTGLGDKVVVNLYHVACWAMQHAVVSRQWGADYPRSRKWATMPSNNSFMSKDGVWFLMCETMYDAKYQLMVEAFEIEELSPGDQYSTLQQVTANKGNKFVIEAFERAFAKKNFSEWEAIFTANSIPYQKAFTVDDVLEDEEAFANDILRKVSYDAYGERVIPTAPIRLSSVGDPSLWTSKPIGYDTTKYMQQCGYSEEKMARMLEQGAVKAYSGEDLAFKKLANTSAQTDLP